MSEPIKTIAHDKTSGDKTNVICFHQSNSAPLGLNPKISSHQSTQLNKYTGAKVQLRPEQKMLNSINKPQKHLKLWQGASLKRFVGLSVHLSLKKILPFWVNCRK